MADDGKCHICRQWPAREDDRYSTLTVCVDCDETRRQLHWRTAGGCSRDQSTTEKTMDPADQYYKDAQRFMATFRRFTTVHFGERCQDFDDGCYACKIWHLIDQTDEIVTGDGPDIHKIGS